MAEFKDVSKSYGAKHVFSGASFIIERGDRIALVGVNGAGKSTMIKLLAGTEPLTSGGPTRWATTRCPIISRRISTRSWTRTRRMLDDLGDAAPRSTQTELRTLLGCFLFSDDDVFKRIGVLSGGERNRYALARMLLAPSNFLLLDEPTNHLDMRAKDVLLESLQQVHRDRGVRLARPLLHRQPGARGSSKSRTATSTSIRAITRITCGERAVARRRSPSMRPTEPEPVPAVPAEPKKRVNPMKVKKLQDRLTQVEQHVATLERRSHSTKPRWGTSKAWRKPCG